MEQTHIDDENKTKKEFDEAKVFLQESIKGDLGYKSNDNPTTEDILKRLVEKGKNNIFFLIKFLGAVKESKREIRNNLMLDAIKQEKEEKKQMVNILTKQNELQLDEQKIDKQKIELEQKKIEKQEQLQKDSQKIEAEKNEIEKKKLELEKNKQNLTQYTTLLEIFSKNNSYTIDNEILASAHGINLKEIGIQKNEDD